MTNLQLVSIVLGFICSAIGSHDLLFSSLNQCDSKIMSYIIKKLTH